MSVQITDRLVSAALEATARTACAEFVDSVEPGLLLRVSGGRVRWACRVRGAKESRLRISLGTWPDVSIAEARELAARLKVTFEPKELPDEPGKMAVGKLLERYDARRLSQLRKGKVIFRALDNALRSVGHRAADEVRRRDITEIVDGMADRAPIHANRVLAYLKAFFGWAVGRGYLEVNPAAGISKPTREVTRDRTPTLQELAEIWVAAGELGYPFGPIVRLLILTASRRDEVGAMRLDEVDLPGGAEDGSWTLPASRSKNGRSIRTPLAPLARATLQEAIAAKGESGPFVFSTTGRAPVSGWSRAKRRLDAVIERSRRARNEASMAPWRFHDLRRAFATAACDVLLVDPAVADRCLNHVGASTTSTVSRIYARNEMFAQRREALEGWAALVAEATNARVTEAPLPDRLRR